jgi:cell division protein FtsW
MTAETVQGDRRILLITVILVAVGASLVASASSYFASAKFSDPYYLIKRHLVRIVLAALVLLVATRIDYRYFRKLSPVGFGLGLASLVALFVCGATIRNTVSWFYVEGLQMTIQPSELARLTLVFFIAYWAARKGKTIEDFKRGFVPLAIAIVAVLGLLAAQPDYGTATATAIIAFLMLFLAGARLRHILLLGLTLLGVAAVRVFSVPYIRERLLSYMDRSDGALDWQPYQSLIGLGTGGILGAGWGESRQKLNWLPDSHTDFIFSILGEEAGLIGTFLVSLLFLLLVLRALKISRHSNDHFGEMIAIGIGCTIFVYAMMNMFVATGLFPVTGLPLPFVSYGGSAMVVNAFSIGVLLNVSKTSWTAKRLTRRPV